MQPAQAISRAISAAFFGARLVRVENESHWIPHDTPGVFAEEVRKFLAES